MDQSITRKKILGIIPARGGSKGIPRKNINLLLGRPLIAYTIGPALKSRWITDLVISSDDDMILAVGAYYGARPLRRPYHLAIDTAHSIPVVYHALTEMERETGITYDGVIMLQPTTPMRTSEDIDNALEKLFSTGADSIISVVESNGVNPEWMKHIVNDALIDYDPTLPEMGRRQDALKLYIRNGAIYAARAEHLKRRQSFKNGVCRPFVMPEARWVNIDSLRDWALAEALMQKEDWSWIKPAHDRSESVATALA
ncbi:MAG: acylneuraminate cytidylyltransferase family protein [Patescibacteria group bacterium]